MLLIRKRGWNFISWQNTDAPLPPAKKIDTDILLVKQTPQHSRDTLRKINTDVAFSKQTPQHTRNRFKKLAKKDEISFVRKKTVHPRDWLKRKTKELSNKQKIELITDRHTDFDPGIIEILQINIEVLMISNGSKYKIMNHIRFACS